jgi:hypothetical protein
LNQKMKFRGKNLIFISCFDLFVVEIVLQLFNSRIVGKMYV